MPVGKYIGYTEPRSKKDITVTIYGSDYQGNEVQIQGQLGHYYSRKSPYLSIPLFALQEYGLCTIKNLAWAMRGGGGTKDSISWGLIKLPEILGQTRSGYCGNPMTLGHFTRQELSHLLNEGQTLPVALSGPAAPCPG